MDAGKDISLFHSEWKVSESVRFLDGQWKSLRSIVIKCTYHRSVCTYIIYLCYIFCFPTSHSMHLRLASLDSNIVIERIMRTRHVHIERWMNQNYQTSSHGYTKNKNDLQSVEASIDRPATACIAHHRASKCRHDPIARQPTLIDRVLGTIRGRYGTFVVQPRVFSCRSVSTSPSR